jgi:hypothetical protein
MRSPVLRIAFAAALAAALAACNRNDGQTAGNTAPAPEQAAPAAPEQAAPAAPAIPAGTEMAVNAVSSAMLSRPADAPDALIIQVTGTAASSGWTDAKLAPEENDGEDHGVRTYRFLATSPKDGDGAASSPELNAELRVDAFPAAVKTVKIVAATNEISLPVTQ